MARVRLRRWLREHGWVVPAAYVVAALVLGVALPQIDIRDSGGPVIETSAAEELLGAIAAGMIAFTGIVFSISLLVAQFWNTAYSLRLMQWLRSTPLMSHSFGVFTATSVYALAALAAVGHDPEHEPTHTVAFAIGMLLASVLLFLLLLFRTLRLMNLSYVLALIGRHGRRAVDDLYADTAAPAPGRELDVSARPSVVVVHQGEPMVVVAIQFGRLVEITTAAEARVDIAVGVGDAISTGAVIARIHGGAVPAADVARAFVLGTERTMEQDPKFALRLLVDVAIKALSSAINDPTTAVQALDQIEDLLHRMGTRTLDLGRLTGVHGYTRVTYPAPTWDDLLALGTDEIRMYGATSLQVMRRLRLVLIKLREAVPGDRRAAVEDRLRRLDAAIERGIPEPDRDDARIPDSQGLGLSHPIEPSPGW